MSDLMDLSDEAIEMRIKRRIKWIAEFEDEISVRTDLIRSHRKLLTELEAELARRKSATTDTGQHHRT